MFALIALQFVLLSAIYKGTIVLASVQHAFSAAGSSDVERVLSPDVVRSIQLTVDAHEVPGLSISIVKTGGFVEYGNWGIRSEAGDAVTSDTLFILASCSKAFTSAAMGLLIEDYAAGKNVTPLPEGLGRLDWDTKLKDILPGYWELMDESASKMTSIKDILSHQTGVPRHDLSYAREDTAKDMVSRLKYMRPAFEIRERWHYNNIMYMTAQHILTTYTGSFTDFVRDRIFLPLNMTSTTYLPSEANESGKATQVWAENGRLIPWVLQDSTAELISGAGGVISSTQDMTRWVQMLLNGGVDPVTNQRILASETIEAVSLARSVMVGTGSSEMSIMGYGMGWMRSSFQGKEIIQHGGSLAGISTLVALSPHDGTGIVALCNGDNKAGALNEAAVTILHKVWGVQADDVLPTLFVDMAMHGRQGRAAPMRTDALEELPPYDFTGLYLNEGYGAFLLCDSKGASAQCANVLEDFATVDGSTPRAAELYAAWPRLSTSHLRFAYAGGTRFAAQAVQLFPQGFGKNTTPFEISSQTVYADFVVRDDGEVLGFGLFGLVGETTDREKKGGSIEETAEVWFDRATWKRVQDTGFGV
ncbi:beta-lactamase/transpeptidase-like protein [Peniophora sp. CONT]|nr:beta-lactamase/transpeptidase-like protein [Peniophora sp. CONT]